MSMKKPTRRRPKNNLNRHWQKKKTLVGIDKKIASNDVGQKKFGQLRPKNSLSQCWQKKPLLTLIEKQAQPMTA